MTLIACAIAGLIAARLIDVASDRLPRLARHRSLPPAAAHLTPALWRWFARRPGAPALSSVLVELATVSLFVYLYLRFGLTGDGLWMAVLIAFFLLVALIDWRYRLVLNVTVFPAAALVVLVSLLDPRLDPLNALLGGAVGFGLFALAALVRPGGLGGGDVKLAALIGLVFGFPHVLWALMVGVLTGGVAVVVLLTTRRAAASSHIPYAPFLCLGAIVALLFNPLVTLLHL
jgi:prepilin signal peptidase PulO-like enzyme (type II secretory pathway)